MSIITSVINLVSKVTNLRTEELRIVGGLVFFLGWIIWAFSFERKWLYRVVITIGGIMFFAGMLSWLLNLE